MALRTKVKVGNITNLSDARYCAGMGVDWLGFDSGAVDPKTFQEITGWVSGPEFVVELSPNGTASDFLAYQAGSIELNLNQLSLLNQLSEVSVFVCLSIAEWVHHVEELIAQKNKIKHIIFNNGTGNHLQDQKIITAASHHFGVIIGYNITAENISNTWLDITGFNLKGSEELKPGLKDYQSLADILESLEVD